jgi:hypothetical protein
MIRSRAIIQLDKKQDVTNNNIIKQLEKLDNLTSSSKVCKSCFSAISNNSIPPFSILNNMKLYNSPEEFRQLNYYEKMLIQLNKSFQSIIKLKPYGIIEKYSDLIPALKGVAIHLPLSLNSTFDYLNKSLPNKDHLNIIVDGLPTSQKYVWRSLVDLNRVLKVLEILKQSNPLYNDIVIDFNSFKLDDAISFKESSNETENSYLKIQDEEYSKNIELEQYSICTIGNINENLTDIEKYASQKIFAEPLNNRDQNLDHKCFPNIFYLGNNLIIIPECKEFLKRLI